MDKSPALTVASNVRAEMARRGVTVLALAEGTGIARSTLIRRLSPKEETSHLTVDELHSIATHLGISVDVLIQTTQPV